MGYSRNARINATRSREEQEDDALDLHEKGYPYEAIGDVLGVSGQTAKSYIKDAKIRRLEQSNIDERGQKKIVPMRKGGSAS